jgi:hypothetical protein
MWDEFESPVGIETCISEEVKGKVTTQLRDLLLDRHTRQEIVDPVLNGCPWIPKDPIRAGAHGILLLGGDVLRITSFKGTILEFCSGRNATGAGERQRRNQSAPSLRRAVIKSIVILENVIVAHSTSAERILERSQRTFSPIGDTMKRSAYHAEPVSTASRA